MEPAEKVEVEQEIPRCGWCCWKPAWLQRIYKWPFALVWLCLFSFFQGFIAHGVTPVNSDTLEKRFKLTSTDIGWFNSAHELSGACTTLILSYLADRKHRPRWLMVSSILFAFGCLVMSLPHFIAEPYNGNIAEMAKTCQSGIATSDTNSLANQEDCSAVSNTVWLSVLIIGNVIVGIGAGIIFTVGLAFIDDFSDERTGPFRIALMFLFAAAGAAAGFGGGSALLRFDVNFNRPDWPQFTGNKDFNPHYCGAWWLGYIVAFVFFSILAIGFSCFDHEMPETAKLKKLRRVETHEVQISIGQKAGERKTSKISKILTKFLAAFLRLVKNPIMICFTIAYISKGIFADGIQPFFMKIIRTQFVMNETKAGMILGILIIAAIGSGAMISGFILKKFDFSLRGLILLVFTAILCATLLSFGFMLHCPQEKLSGITVDYENFNYLEPIPKFQTSNLETTCNSKCNCEHNLYTPVCYRKMGVEFYSPCHAGCRVEKTVDYKGMNVEVFVDCDCLLPFFYQQRNMSKNEQVQFETLKQLAATLGQDFTPRNPELLELRQSYMNFTKDNVMVNGLCDSSCSSFYPAIVILFFILFFGYFIPVPVSNILMRCVQAEDKSMALAFYGAAERFLGAIPGPILIGTMIDRVCLFRDSSSKCEEGSCQGYDTPQLARWMVGIFFSLHGFALLCYLLAFFLYKPPNGQTTRQFLQQSFCRKSIKQDQSKNDDESHKNEAFELEQTNQ